VAEPSLFLQRRSIPLGAFEVVFEIAECRLAKDQNGPDAVFRPIDVPAQADEVDDVGVCAHRLDAEDEDLRDDGPVPFLVGLAVAGQ
jgi:hypothetical protein